MPSLSREAGQFTSRAPPWNGGLPCPKPSCKPAGRRREVKARLEEPGGGFLAFLLFRFQTNQSEEIICKKVKVIFIKSSSFIHL